MDRSWLAGIAGFCAACSILMFWQVQQLHKTSTSTSTDRQLEDAEGNLFDEQRENRTRKVRVSSASFSVQSNDEKEEKSDNGDQKEEDKDAKKVADTSHVELTIKSVTSGGVAVLATGTELNFDGPEPIEVEVTVAAKVNSEKPKRTDFDAYKIYYLRTGSSIESISVTSATQRIPLSQYGEYALWLGDAGADSEKPAEDVWSFSVKPKTKTPPTDNNRITYEAKLDGNIGQMDATNVYQFSSQGPEAQLVLKFTVPNNLEGTPTSLTLSCDKPFPIRISATKTPPDEGEGGTSSTFSYTFPIDRAAEYHGEFGGFIRLGSGLVSCNQKISVNITDTPDKQFKITNTKLTIAGSTSPAEVFATDLQKPVTLRRTDSLVFETDAEADRKLVLGKFDPATNRILSDFKVGATPPELTIAQAEINQLPQESFSNFVLYDKWSGLASRQPESVVAIQLNRVANLAKPRIEKYSTSGLKGTEQPISDEGIKVPGQSLRLFGFGHPGSTAEVRLFGTNGPNGTSAEIQSISFACDSSGRWSGDFAIPLNIAGEGYLIVQCALGNQRSLSDPIRVTRQEVDSKSPDFAITKVESDGRNISTNLVSTTASIKVTVKIDEVNDGDVLSYALGEKGNSSLLRTNETKEYSLEISDLKPGENSILLSVQRSTEPPVTRQLRVTVISTGPIVDSVTPVPAGVASPVGTLRVAFKGRVPLNEDAAKEAKNYRIVGKTGASRAPRSAVYDKTSNVVTLQFSEVDKDTGNITSPPVDDYTLHINGGRNPEPVFGFSDSDKNVGIKDIYGNFLAGDGKNNETNYSFDLSGLAAPPSAEPSGSGSGGAVAAGFKPRTIMELPTVTAEVPNLTELQTVGLPDYKGTPVDYPEFTKPRKEQDGFNPSDKVVSRVARLYYYRDAHRVAQIINRRSKSQNAHNASLARQMADKARIYAEQVTDRRRSAEREAVEAASYARHAENAIAKYRANLDAANAAVTSGQRDAAVVRSRIETLEGEATPTDPKLAQAHKAEIQENKDQLARIQQAITQGQAEVTTYQQLASASVAALDALREQELQQREVSDRELANDDRAADHQFRLEVQAAHTDPDTYAEGIPNSQDPVAQVTLSVIGEGLIQMRGPLKGVNIVQTMIHEIDAPAGQVRVGIHTIQINGEKGADMEVIADRIQRYTDHSRFLTSQSAQMLRNAVATVASRKAQECGVVCEGGAPICEDGEILQMSAVQQDIGSAQGMMPVAMNRYQDAFFGHEFMDHLRQMDSEFVKTSNHLISLHSMDTTSLASALFLMALASNDTRMEILAEFERQTMCKLPIDEFEYFEASDTKKWYHFNKFKFMSDNARFVSLRGYFNAEISGNDTLNPAQREFIKLAQILKSRLISEIELKQRVVERSLIEERIGNYRNMIQNAALKEAIAIGKLNSQRGQIQTQTIKLTQVLQGLRTTLPSVIADNRRKLRDSELAFRGRFRYDKNREVQLARAYAAPYLPANVAAGNTQATTPTSPMSENLSSPNNEATAVTLQSKAEVESIISALEEQKRSLTYNPLGRSSKSIDDAIAKIRELQEKHYIRLGEKFNIILVCEKKGSGVWTIEIGSLPDFDAWADEVLKEEASLLKEFGLLTPRANYYVDVEAARSIAKENFYTGMAGFQLNFEKTIEEINSNLSTRHDRVIVLVEQLQKLLVSVAAARSPEVVAKGAIPQADEFLRLWNGVQIELGWLSKSARASGETATSLKLMESVAMQSGDEDSISTFLKGQFELGFLAQDAVAARRPLDHKKFLDMLIDEAEEKHIQLLEGTRAHTAVIDDYIKRICTALEDDFRTQFYDPAFRCIREETYRCGTVSLGQIEHTSVLTNNREFAKVQPQATMEFDLPKRRIVVAEALAAAQAGVNDYGALLNDPNFLALTKLYSGQPTSHLYGSNDPNSPVRDVLPGLPSQSAESAAIQARTGEPEFQSQLEALVPDPAIYKFETGTGYEIRPVIQPDGQSVVFDFNYMYTTNVREPVDADEKHLGRVKRHFIDTDVQIGNYELREVSRYRVALKAERSGRGVPLLEDVPVAGALFRPMNDGESSLQQNIILAHSVIYPTMFDLMGLRWAPAVADITEEDVRLQEFTYRNRMRNLKNEVYDYSSSQVDEFLRIPEGERRADLYRTQVPIPVEHPNGYIGPGNNQQDSTLQEGYVPEPQSGNRGVMSPGAEMVPLGIPHSLPLDDETILHDSSGGYELPAHDPEHHHSLESEDAVPLNVAPAGYQSERGKSSKSGSMLDQAGRAKLHPVRSAPSHAEMTGRGQLNAANGDGIQSARMPRSASSNTGARRPQPKIQDDVARMPSADSAGTSTATSRPSQPTGKTGIGWRLRNLGGRKSSNSP